MLDNELRELGWQPHFEQQVLAEDFDRFLLARVCAHHGSHILFLTIEKELSVPTSIVELADDGTETTEYSNIAVGDWFLLDRDDHRAVRRLQRKTVLARKAAGETVKPQLIAANVDFVFIVSSCNLDFNLSRLERFLALVLESGATPIVVLTKKDLHEDPASLRQQAERLHSGLIVETMDARDESQTECLNEWCGLGRTVALLGSSGVGKSTIANTLGGHDILTKTVRADDDKGRHTTTARSLHKLKTGGWLIDNPGMRELQLADCETGVADLFDDILQLAGQCRFRDCSHQGDAGCAVEAAIETGQMESRRLVSYLKLQSEQARNSTSLAERRERERNTGQFYKRVIAEKKRRRDS